MNVIKFNLWDRVTVAIEGEGPVCNRIYATLRHFEADDVDIPDIKISCIRELSSIKVNTLLGAPKEYFTVVEDDYVFAKHGESVRVNQDFTEIRASHGAPPDLVRMLMELKIRHALVDEGFSMVHASGVVYNGKAIIFPAWRHTGKTNTVLSFLQKGASFLADDRLLLGSDGTVLGYPTDLHLLSYNYRSFPSIAPQSILSKVRGAVSRNLNATTSQRNSILFKGINLMNDAVVTEDHWLSVKDVFPDSNLVFQTNLNSIVLLRTTTRGNPYIVDISCSELATALRAINFREWDNTLLEASLNFSSFKHTTAFNESVQTVINTQKEVFSNIPDDVKIQMLCIPRQETWDQSVKQKIFDIVNETT
jgi:hypothetical protein